VKALEQEVRALKMENTQLRDQVSFFRRYYGQGTVPSGSSSGGAGGGAGGAAPAASVVSGGAWSVHVGAAKTPAAASSTGRDAGDGGSDDGDDGASPSQSALRLLSAWATRHDDNIGAAGGAEPAFGSEEFDRRARDAEEAAARELQQLTDGKSALEAER
jgi:hypothetical protein